MKNLDKYITEKLHINNTTKIEYMYHPKIKHELIKCIKNKIKKEGLGTKDNPLNLNDIDVSYIMDMSDLFSTVSYGPLKELSLNRYFNISDWDVSNVRDMSNMFYGSAFNGDISNWDVRNVKDMSGIFAHSDFTGKNSDISKWNVSNVTNMANMFRDTKFNGDISDWDVSKVENMINMFYHCTEFNCDLSDWDVSNVTIMLDIFSWSPLQNNPPKWYKPLKR